MLRAGHRVSWLGCDFSGHKPGTGPAVLPLSVSSPQTARQVDGTLAYFPIKAPSVVSPPTLRELGACHPWEVWASQGGDLVCSALAGPRDGLQASLAVRQGVSSVSPPPAEPLGRESGGPSLGRPGAAPPQRWAGLAPTAAVLAGRAFSGPETETAVLCLQRLAQQQLSLTFVTIHLREAKSSAL